VDVGQLIAVGVIAVVTLAGSYLFPSREERDQRELEAYPDTLVSEGSGAVRVTGRVHGVRELLEAPLTGRPCVAYELIVGGQMPAGYLRLMNQQDARPFLVTDESGTARVDTSGPFRLALRPQVGTTSGPYPGKHKALSLLLESRGLRAENWLGRWRRLNYAERVLEQEQLVSIGGPSDREPDPTAERSGPRSPPLRLVLRGTENHPLVIAANKKKA
jgi:hypothetical protein